MSHDALDGLIPSKFFISCFALNKCCFDVMTLYVTTSTSHELISHLLAQRGQHSRACDKRVSHHAEKKRQKNVSKA